jgi:trehalose 6-phosphate synthase/phosphatase
MYSAPKYSSIGELQFIAQAFKQSQKKLLLLDFDGTLVTRFEPHDTVSTELINILERLILRNSRVVIISGRDRLFLENNLRIKGIQFAAEYGAFIFRESWERKSLGAWQAIFKSRLMTRLTHLNFRLEEKEVGIVFHMQDPPKKLFKSVWRDLCKLTGHPVEILIFKTSIELRTATHSKGSAAKTWLETEQPDFILSIGNDMTDEKMFDALPASAYTFRVGKGRTGARFRFSDPDNVRMFLATLSEL